MWRKLITVGCLGAAAAAGLFFWFGFEQERKALEQKTLTLYGNVDDRQVALAFQIPERIESLKVEEGDSVKSGELLGTLENVRVRNSLTQATAACEAAKQAYFKLKNGSRPEEIAIAKAAVSAAEAYVFQTERNDTRQETLMHQSASSQLTADKAKADHLMAKAALDAARSKHALLLAGPRAEEIAQALAEYQTREAEVTIARQKLADTELFSPVAGIVRKRLLEPGEIASPEQPALLLAIESPKWVRTYLSEREYGKLSAGMKCQVKVDSRPEETFAASVGFISPNAEFTPKSVETTELRPDLVYEIRIVVEDPQNRLLLGQPATVNVLLP